MSSYAEALFGTKYKENAAPAILLSDELHRETVGFFNSWKAAMKINGKFDWKKVSGKNLIQLWEGMFDVAGVSKAARNEYYNQFQKYLENLK